MGQLSLDALVDETASLGEVRVAPDDWDRYRVPAGGPQIVVGGPGTGKTEFLARRVGGAIESGVPPERILVLSFSRAGVNDLRDRMTALLGPRSHRIITATYHSIAMRLVECRSDTLGWRGAPTVLTAAEQEALVARLLGDADADAWSSAFRPILDTEPMAAEVTNFILRAREQRLWADDIAQVDRDQWKGLPAFLRAYDAELLRTNRTDYGRLLVEAVEVLERHEEIAETYQVVVADEYQDTSPVQAALVRTFAHTTGDLTVAADPYQSIYSFRGSDIRNVYSFPAEMEAITGTAAERLVLTTSFRVPSEILDAAVAVTARELPGGAGKVRSTRSSGSVACHEFPTAGIEAEWIAGDIERIHLTQGVPLERIAVFVRTHTEFVEDLVRAMERRSITHSHVDDRLADEPIVRFVHDLVAATGDDDAAIAALRRILQGPMFGWAPGRLASLPDDRGSWSTWLCGHGAELEPLAELLDDASWCRSEPATHGLWTVWSSLPQLRGVATDPRRERERRAFSAFAQAVDRAVQRTPEVTLFDNVELSTNIEFEADSLFAVRPETGVTVAPLHRAKGTEFDVVYIADAVEGQLPDLRARDSILGVRHLNPHLPTRTSDYVTFRLDEERRLAYTAMTRSTSRVVWTATTASDRGEGRSPSRFMRLVADTTEPTVHDRPLTPRAYIARARRTISDPKAPTSERLAALAFIAGPAAELSDPLDRYGVRERGDTTPIAPAELQLSPSQATSFQRCPRRYGVERFIFSHTEETPYLLLGNLVHAVVEDAERNALGEGRHRASLDEALAVLERLWPDSGFADDAVGLAWRNRAKGLLENLYSAWPSDGEAVELEVELSVDLGGIPWKGRADRVERRGDRLTIVDYKTGTAVRLDEAASSAQLGYYLLAARLDPAITRHGDVEGAEFWHPKSLTRGSVTTRSFDVGLLDEVRDDLVAIALAIRNQDFTPMPGDGCRTCPATSTCPAQPQGDEAFVS